jgi:hypothetical protein
MILMLGIGVPPRLDQSIAPQQSRRAARLNGMVNVPAKKAELRSIELAASNFAPKSMWTATSARPVPRAAIREDTILPVGA